MTYQHRITLVLLVALLCILPSSPQTIPTIVPDNPLLNGQANYILNYFVYKQLLATSYFQVNFSQADIVVPNGKLNVTATANGNVISSATTSVNCTSQVCIIKLGTILNVGTNVVINFGLMRNPKYTSSQRISVFIYYSSSSNQTQSISVSSTVYVPMPVSVNSISQSDFGVGSLNVTYIFNISFSYIPSNPQISITIPSQITYNTLQIQLTFYGSNLTVTLFLTTSMIILTLNVTEFVSPNGFMLLSLTGFSNPSFIGSSSSFNITMVQKMIPTSNNCVTCMVAQLYTNSSSLIKVSSTTPGDITINMFNPSSTFVNQQTNLTIGFTIVAPIPSGGKFRLLLPSSIQPSNNMYCQAIYGFTITNPASCVYNSVLHAIETVNYSRPYLVQTGDAIIKIGVINAPDNRQTNFSFETLDDQNRKIGKSKISYLYRSSPLVLNLNLNKTSTLLQQNFNLNLNLSLSQSLQKGSSKIVLTLPPSQFYNLSLITCMSSLINLNCSKTIDVVSLDLVISFAPPCHNCSVGQLITVSIAGLVNPSYVNDQMQTIKVQTHNLYGVVEQYHGILSLKQNSLGVQSYQWIGNNTTVGAPYTFNLRLTVPRYVQKYGGYIVVEFEQNSTYLSVNRENSSAGLYSYISSLSIRNQNNISLSNSISYYQNTYPSSLKSILIAICSTPQSCGSSLSIENLLRPFNPLVSISTSISSTTLNNQAVSMVVLNCNAFIPTARQATLALTIGSSFANMISDYVFAWKSESLPFDSGVVVKLSNKHAIQNNSKCFVQMQPASLLGFGIDCTIINSTSVVLTYDSSDPTLMTTSSINYSLTITSILNPPSTSPLLYSFQTSFSSIPNSMYSTLTSLSQPYPLVINNVITSNQTYGQNNSLSFSLGGGFYQQFDQMRIYITKMAFNRFLAFNSIALASFNGTSPYLYSENATHFIISKIYSISTYTILLSLTNAQLSNVTGQIVVATFVQGYLSASGTITTPTIMPAYIYATCVSDNRNVGETTTLTFNIKRTSPFSQQQTLNLIFGTNSFTIGANHLLTQNQTNNDMFYYSQNVNTMGWNNYTRTISVTLDNMMYIPNANTLSKLSQIVVQTLDSVDSNGKIIAMNYIDLSSIVSSQVKSSLSYNFIRSSVQPRSLSNLTINFTSKYPTKVKLVKVDLPLTENQLSSTSACFIQSTTQIPCTVLSNSTNSMTIQLPQNINITQQQTIILTSVMNLYPSNNNLTLTLMTSNFQNIQVSTKNIMPSILLDPLEVSSQANSTTVADNVRIDFLIKNLLLDIAIGSTLKFVMPNKIYTKILSINSLDCNYTINGISYSNCQYINNQANDSSSWLQYIQINNLGPTVIPTGSIIKVTLYLTNPFTAYPFNLNKISVIFSNPQAQPISSGSVLLSSLNGSVTGFTPATIGTYSFNQSLTVCGQDNTINISVNTSIYLNKNSYLYVLLPVGFYDLISSESTSTLSFVNLVNSSFIQVQKQIECSSQYPNSSSSLCVAPTTISLSFKMKNDKYFNLIAQSLRQISFFLFNDGYYGTSPVSIQLADRIPAKAPSITLTRNVRQINAYVNSTIYIDMGLSFNSAFKISVTPISNSLRFIESPQSVLISASANGVLNFNNLNSSLILSCNSIQNSSISFVVSGQNPQYAWNSQVQTYQVTIYTDSVIYFSNIVNVTGNNCLSPLNSGFLVLRSNNVVGANSNYSITGSLPYNSLINSKLNFNNTILTLASGSLTFNNFLIGSYLNAISTNWLITQSLKIFNDTHVLYENNNLEANPTLQSLKLNASLISKVKYNSEMRTNTIQTIQIDFNMLVIKPYSLQKVMLKIPQFYSSIKSINLNNNTLLSTQYTISTSTLKSHIQIPLINLNSSTLSSISLMVLTSSYQQIIINKTIQVQLEYPTRSVVYDNFTVRVFGQSLVANLIMLTNKVNQLNKFSYLVNTINRDSVLTIYLPLFMNYQIATNLQTVSTDNLMSLNVNGVNNNISTILYDSNSKTYYLQYQISASSKDTFTLNISNVINPLTNEPFYLIAQQHQLSSIQKIFSHTSNLIQMNILQPLNIKSCVRNTSKIGLATQIKIQIQIPLGENKLFLQYMPSKQCIIAMPATQVVRMSTCKVERLNANNTTTTLPCKAHPKLQNAIVTTCDIGLNTYIIKQGYQNMLYSIVPKDSDKPFVYIGDSYQMAQSNLTQTGFLTPVITAGNISLSKIKTSSNVRLQQTSLNLELMLQNIKQVDSISLKFEQSNYLFSEKNLKCALNGQQRSCWSSGNATILINSTQLAVKNISIQINGLINFLSNANFTIHTLKYVGTKTSSSSGTTSSNSGIASAAEILVRSASLSQYAQIDVFYSTMADSPGQFLSNHYKVRLINPNNYVSAIKQRIEIIFDDSSLLPASLDKNSLKFNITSNINNCNLIHQNFSSKFMLQCIFDSSTNAQFTTVLYLADHTSISLSSSMSSSYIYPPLHSQCIDQSCDLCSTSASGSQVCFSCRESLYVFNSSCLPSCPSGTTTYPSENGNTCQQCLTSCLTCYNIYVDGCLKCMDTTMISQEGICKQQCQDGMPQNGYCVGDRECYDQGCDKCSNNGFCYQCLPDFEGAPTCTWVPLLPSLFMTFFDLPFLLFAIISSIVVSIRMGVTYLSHQIIFSFSLLEFATWVFIIPAFATKSQAMIVLALILLRIVIGIVAYETYYKKQINGAIGLSQQQSLLSQKQVSQQNIQNKQSQNQNKSQQKSQVKSQIKSQVKCQPLIHNLQDNLLSKLIRFLSHIIGIDAYPAMNIIFDNKIRLKDNNTYLCITMINRLLVGVLMVYQLVQGKGDMAYLPIIALTSGFIVCATRISKSNLFKQCMQRFTK